jgi:hypothetical protein
LTPVGAINMLPRHDDDRENHDQNRQALAGFGSRARVKSAIASSEPEAPPEKVRGFFIGLLF